MVGTMKGTLKATKTNTTMTSTTIKARQLLASMAKVPVVPAAGATIPKKTRRPSVTSP